MVVVVVMDGVRAGHLCWDKRWFGEVGGGMVKGTAGPGELGWGGVRKTPLYRSSSKNPGKMDFTYAFLP